MSRVAIHHPKDPTRPCMIASERYDPARHRLWGAAEPVVGLPEDIPGRAALAAAGVTTLEAVRAIRDFDEIAGIGEITEQRLVDYLAAQDES